MFDSRACIACSVLVLATGCAGLAVPVAETPVPAPASYIEALALESDPLAPGADSARPLGTAAAQEAPSDSRWHGDVDFLFGVRGMFDEGWDPFEGQGVLGAQMTIRPPRSMVGVEFGAALSGSSDEDGPNDTDIEGWIGEMWIGPQFALSDRRRGSMDVFVGLGVTYVNGTTERVVGVNTVVDDSDSSAGGYGHAGLAWRVSKTLRLGFDVRGVFGTDLTLHNQNADADYVQAAFLLGIGW